MQALRSFEDWLTGLLEDRLGGLLGRKLEPVDFERKLARHMDDNRVIGAGHRYVPNAYRLYLPPGTLERYEHARQTLEESLARSLFVHARQHGYDLLGRVKVAVTSDPALARSAIRVEAEMAELRRVDDGSTIVHTQAIRTAASATPPPPLAIRMGGRDVCLVGAEGARLGRSLENDIIVDDASVSRRHATITPRNGQWLVEDRDSRGGTFLNGRRVTAAYVRPGDRLQLGSIVLDLQSAEPDDSA